MKKLDLLVAALSFLILGGTVYYVGVSFDIVNSFNVNMLFFILKNILMGILIVFQMIVCITLSGMIILQKSDDGPFKKSLNTLMYKADNVALHNNTKWFILAMAFNSLLIQLIW